MDGQTTGRATATVHDYGSAKSAEKIKTLRDSAGDLLEAQHQILGRVAELRDKLTGSPAPTPSVPSLSRGEPSDNASGSIVGRDLCSAMQTAGRTLDILRDLGERV